MSTARQGLIRGTGIFPLSREHVLQKLAPNTTQAIGNRETDSGRSQEQRNEETTTATLIDVFSELLGVKRDRPDVSQRNKFKVQLSGQANDSFLSLMEEDMARKEAEKEKKKGKTRKRAPLQKAKEAEFNENVCQNCGTDYDDDDDQDAWIGCDVENCNRWFHFYCYRYSGQDLHLNKSAFC